MMNYLDFCEELFDKLTQDISQDYSDSSFFCFNNLIDCNWTRGDGFTFVFKIPTLNDLIFHEHLDESFIYEEYSFQNVYLSVRYTADTVFRYTGKGSFFGSSAGK